MAQNDLTRVWKERNPEKKKAFVANHKCLVGGVAMLLLAALARIFLPDETFKFPAVFAFFLLMWNALVVTWQRDSASERWLSIGAAILSVALWFLAKCEIGFLTIGMEVFTATAISYLAKEGWRMLRNMKK